MKNKSHSIYSTLPIPILYFLIIFTISNFHTTFEEWDGVMQYVSGYEIVHGAGYIGWASHFWPPLFSLLIGLLSDFISGFLAGKLISIFSSVFTLFFVYYIVLEFTQERKIAYIAQLFIAINPLFALLSIQVENHMLDTFFFIGGIYFLIKSTKEPQKIIYVVLLACFVAFATLSRYTSYALVPLVFIVIIFFSKREYALRNSLLFSGFFILINSPWYYYNFLQNESILHSWQYINIGTGVYPGSRGEWWFYKHSEYSSISQIIFDYPKEYILNFFKNIIKGGIATVISIKFIFLIMFGMWWINRKKIDLLYTVRMLIKNNYFQILIIGYIGFLVLVSQAFVFPEVFLSWTVILTIFIIILSTKMKINLIILSTIFLINISFTGKNLIHYCKNDDYDNGQMVKNKEVTKTLKNQRGIDTSYVMSINPARAYYAGSYWMETPEFFKGSIQDLVTYNGMPEKAKKYAPKFPMDDEAHADYLVYDINTKKYLPQFSFLLDTQSPRIPTYFRLLYASENVVVYKIDYENSTF